MLPAGRELRRDGRVPLRLGSRQRALLEREALPNFLGVRRWFAAKSGEVERVEIGETVEIQDGDKSFVLALLRVHMAGEDGQGPQLYALPLSAAWETGKEDLLQRLVQYAVAKLRRRSKMGVLYDAVADEDFSHSLLAAMSEGREVKMSGGEIRFARTNVFATLAGEDAGASLQVRRSGVEQTNTSIILGERLVLKLYRRLQRGTNPDLEVGRFLTEIARFENTPPLAGAAE